MCLRGQGQPVESKKYTSQNGHIPVLKKKQKQNKPKKNILPVECQW